MASKTQEIKKDTDCPHCHGMGGHSRKQRKSCKSKGGGKSAPPSVNSVHKKE